MECALLLLIGLARLDVASAQENHELSRMASPRRHVLTGAPGTGKSDDPGTARRGRLDRRPRAGTRRSSASSGRPQGAPLPTAPDDVPRPAASQRSDLRDAQVASRVPGRRDLRLEASRIAIAYRDRIFGVDPDAPAVIASQDASIRRSTCSSSRRGEAIDSRRRGTDAVRQRRTLQVFHRMRSIRAYEATGYELVEVPRALDRDDRAHALRPGSRPGLYRIDARSARALLTG